MRRLHLFELEDQTWFPRRLRDYMTDFLESVSRYFAPYDPCLPLLHEFLRVSGQERIVDLCSGGGGPWCRWLEKGAVPARVTLTDRFPNLPTFERLHARLPHMDYSRDPVDATAVPDSLQGLRTLFTALHHLSPECVVGMFQDAARAGQPLAAFEFNQRDWRHIVAIPPLAFVACLLLTPLIQPWRLDRFLLTYALPLVPLAASWDGFVSQLRSYRVDELEELCRQAERPGYRWEVGQRRWRGLVKLTYVFGRPV